MKVSISALLFILASALSAAFGQSGGTYAITQSVIAGGGGGPSTGGTYSITGTIGQSVAGNPTSGGAYGVTAGFWTPSPLGTTAATVPVSGRVLDAAGNPLRNVVVSMSDSSGSVLVTRTNAFGYFVFDEVRSGETFIVNITARTHTFAPAILSVKDALTGLEFRSVD